MSKPIPSLIILAAGASSRMKKSLEALNEEPQFRNSVENLNKHKLPAANTHKGLIPIDKQGNTAIDLLINQAQKAGISRVIMVIQPPGTAIKNHFEAKNQLNDLKDKSKFDSGPNISFDFAYQTIPEGREKPMGTADAIQQCIEQYPELHHQEFIVCNADNLYSCEAFSALINATCSNAMIGYDREGLDFPLEKIRSFALLVNDPEHYMTELIEKPDSDITQKLIDQGQQLNVSMNLWKFKGADLWKALLNCPVHPERQEKELPTAVRLMIIQNQTKLLVIPRKEHVPDLTQASDIAAVRLFLQEQALDS